MELIDCFYQEGEPPVHTFVFNQRNDHGDWAMLRLRQDDSWPFSPFLYGEYHRGQPNEHLGVRVLQQQLGQVVLDRLFTRLGY